MPSPWIGSILMTITTVGFDADDTLWHDARYFAEADERLRSSLARHLDPILFSKALQQIHERNLDSYGYGVNGYVLSAIETLANNIDGELPQDAVLEIIETGRVLLARQIDLVDDVHEVLSRLKGRVELVLITKGDLLHQERKIASSGVAGYFERIEIVAGKSAETYRRIFGVQAESDPAAAMIGDSIRSDILPAIEAGLWGLHVPSEINWEHETGVPPATHPRYRKFATLAGVGDWLCAQI